MIIYIVHVVTID